MESEQLSEETKLRVALLFPPDQQEEAERLLTEECGSNLPFLKDCDSVKLDRFRFAALKLSGGELDKLHSAVRLAQQDWRDLLMAAGFGQVDAHIHWLPQKHW